MIDKNIEIKSAESGTFPEHKAGFNSAPQDKTVWQEGGYLWHQRWSPSI